MGNIDAAFWITQRHIPVDKSTFLLPSIRDVKSTKCPWKCRIIQKVNKIAFKLSALVDSPLPYGLGFKKKSKVKSLKRTLNLDPSEREVSTHKHLQ